MPMTVTNGVFSVQNTFGWVIVRRGESRLSGLMTADCAQKFRTKAWTLDSPVAGLTSPSWLPGMATGAERIIAMSRHKPRQELALAYGATDLVAERGDEGIT